MKKTIQSISEEILNNMEQKERQDGTKFYTLKEMIQWQQDIIRAAHLDRLPNDDIYERIDTILSKFADTDKDAGEEDFRDGINEIEADVYTHDLTAWLHNDVNNVYYLTQAIEDFSPEDGFNLLQTAQIIYIQDIANSLLEAIIKYIDNN